MNMCRNYLGSLLIAAAALGLSSCGGGSSQDPTPRAGQPSEVVSVAGRVTGGGITMDVQIGHTFAQKPSANGDTRAEGAAVIK